MVGCMPKALAILTSGLQKISPRGTVSVLNRTKNTIWEIVSVKKARP